jgi:hypothetical protein
MKAIIMVSTPDAIYIVQTNVPNHEPVPRNEYFVWVNEWLVTSPWWSSRACGLVIEHSQDHHRPFRYDVEVRRSMSATCTLRVARSTSNRMRYGPTRRRYPTG